MILTQSSLSVSKFANYEVHFYLAIVDGVGEEVVPEEVLECGVLVVGLLDVAQEDGADDAAAAPHQRDRTVVQVPLEQLRSLAQEHEALGNNSMEMT